MLLNNKTIIACAGSGKTTQIVEESLNIKNQKILITTYTNENLDQIKEIFIKKTGCIPKNITVQSWFSFLLQEGVRPYQNHMTDQERVKSIIFLKKISRFHKKENYISTSNDIYSNKVSEFVFECNKKTKGLIIKRLERIYDYIFIDELQDFAGYDLCLLENFFNSNIYIVVVGDPRQATFSTNNALKNRQYRKSNIYLWLNDKQNRNDVITEELNECYRSNQYICDFADKLFPDLSLTTSKNSCSTKHDGIFFILHNEVKEYINNYNPTILRYSIKTDTLGFASINIGLSKGRTYNRVLIFPTKPMLCYLKTNDISKVGDKSKLYVAITRAKYSVAFVVKDKSEVNKDLQMFIQS